MNYTVKQPLITFSELIRAYPLSEFLSHQIHCHRTEIKNILTGLDSRLLMIIGPCSAWPNEAVMCFAENLKKLSEKIKHKIKIVMRVYTQKPRTTIGWAGPITQPDPFSPPDINAGLIYARKMMLEIAKMDLSVADEALTLDNADGFLELLSWVAIGARSAENQTYRIFSSRLHCPVGLKNPTHGSLEVAVNSVIAAQHAHTTSLHGVEIQTHGNPYAHLVLRGSSDGPNYSETHLYLVKQLFEQHRVAYPAIIIDASHENCVVENKKEPRLQEKVIFETLNLMKKNGVYRKLIKGFMVESFLKTGNQLLSHHTKNTVDYAGLSVTDPCLGWDESEALLLELADRYD